MCTLCAFGVAPSVIPEAAKKHLWICFSRVMASLGLHVRPSSGRPASPAAVMTLAFQDEDFAILHLELDRFHQFAHAR